MKWQILVLGFIGVFMFSCVGPGIYHVSEKPLPEGDGIYLLKPDGTYDVNYGFRSGRYPDANSDEDVILWVKPHSEVPGGSSINQVWHTNLSNGGTVLLTHSSGDKKHPRWGHRWYAYQRETTNGDKIVVSSHNNLTQFELPPIVIGGMDFFDDGNKIVYTADDGVYWISAEPNATPERIAECARPASQCRFPVISHDGTLLAYRHTVPLGSGWIESIRIVQVGTWAFFKTVMLGPPANLRGIYSFDFSPDDNRLFVTARAADVTNTSGNNNLEIFSIKLDSSDQQRITNNSIPDYYPSTVPGAELEPDTVYPRDVAVGSYHSCYLANGNVTCWGDNRKGQTEVPNDLISPTQIASGGEHVCVIDQSVVKCWGSNDHGQLEPPSTLLNPTHITAGLDHTCVIDGNHVKCWGWNYHGQCDVPVDLQNPVQISAGAYHSCAVDDSGVRCWGDNQYGQLNVPPNINRPDLIAANSHNTCVIEDDMVTCWGGSSFSGITDVPNTVITHPEKIGVGGNHICIIDGGGIVCWGLNDTNQTNVPAGLTNQTAISSKWRHTCTLGETGISCWGWNQYGQLDIPTP